MSLTVCYDNFESGFFFSSNFYKPVCFMYNKKNDTHKTMTAHSDIYIKNLLDNDTFLKPNSQFNQCVPLLFHDLADKISGLDSKC